MRLAWVGLALLVASCSGLPQAHQTAEGIYEIRVPALTPISGSPDPVHAAWKAKETCPRGYDEVKRTVDRTGDRPVFVMTIRCL